MPASMRSCRCGGRCRALPDAQHALNENAHYWFAATDDIVPNHLVDVPDPNVIRARECELVALEFVVRAYITGVTKTSL